MIVMVIVMMMMIMMIDWWIRREWRYIIRVSDTVGSDLLRMRIDNGGDGEVGGDI